MNEISFAEQKNGYDKDQVDNYILKLTGAYQRTYEEYIATCEKYNTLMEDFKQLEEEKQIGINSNVVSKVLMDSEKLAQDIVETAYKIIANAYTEEARIVEKARRNFEQANEKIEQAMSEAQKFFTFRNTKELGGPLNEMQIAT
ncbi:MAG: DivIVA domain-containing protein [Oscillospiraceae bacterium]|nr:DivIVA domain-containing protein [Oscillospiraceae bacterium]